MKPLNILMATDFSSNAKIAAEFVAAMNQNFDISFDIVHVIPSVWRDWFCSGDYKQESFDRLQSWQLDLVQSCNRDQLHVEYGNPADVILEVAHRTKSDLIVLGGKEPQTSARYVSDSVAHSVISHAKSSVLVCQRVKMSTVLCAIDGSDSSAKALRFAQDLCRHFSASLSLLNVIPHCDFNPLGMDEKEIAKQEKAFKISEINRINQFLAEFDFTDTPVTKHFLRGKPSRVILNMAEDTNCDLLVIGHKGQSLLQHIMIGSTAEKILRYVPCSLLVVR